MRYTVEQMADRMIEELGEEITIGSCTYNSLAMLRDHDPIHFNELVLGFLDDYGRELELETRSRELEEVIHGS